MSNKGNTNQNQKLLKCKNERTKDVYLLIANDCILDCFKSVLDVIETFLNLRSEFPNDKLYIAKADLVYENIRVIDEAQKKNEIIAEFKTFFGITEGDND